MYDIVLDIEAVLVWYVLLVIGILILTSWASVRHRTPLPFAWGLTIGVMILWLREYLAPIVFGVMNYSWTAQPILFALTGIFAVCWFGYIAMTLYNLLKEGEMIL
jgi:hypothetical protein